jgi:hypothetical protein
MTRPLKVSSSDNGVRLQKRDAPLAGLSGLLTHRSQRSAGITVASQ